MKTRGSRGGSKLANILEPYLSQKKRAVVKKEATKKEKPMLYTFKLRFAQLARQVIVVCLLTLSSLLANRGDALVIDMQ